MLLLAAVLAAASDPSFADLDARVLPFLKGTREDGAIVLHFDPATVPPEAAAAEAARAREALASLEKRLETRWTGRADVFLYADLAEFRARTGAPSAWEGFASGGSSIHVPRGAPLRHEFAHLLARRFPVPGAEPPATAPDPGGLLREGLAVAMEGTDRGVPASSFAAVYARLGLLPRLADLRDRWPEGPPREFNPYHAAGSFVEWLLATDGLAKVKEVYARPARAEEILGRDWEALEAGWLAWLDARPVPDAEEDAVRREFLLPTAKLPAALAAAAGEPLFGAESPGAASGPKASAPSASAPSASAPSASAPSASAPSASAPSASAPSASAPSASAPSASAPSASAPSASAPSASAPSAQGWTREGGLLRGEGKDDWSLLGPAREWKGEFALRVVARAGTGAGLLLRLNHVEGRADEALLTPQGVGVTLGGGLEGLSRAAVRLVPGRWTSIVLAQEKGTARLYLDGRLVVEARGAFGTAGGGAAIGVRGGTVEIRSAEILPAAGPSPGR